MSIKQLNSHFNWINGLSFLVFVIVNIYLVFFLKMKTFGYYYSISIKFVFQSIVMITVIYLKGNSNSLIITNLGSFALFHRIHNTNLRSLVSLDSFKNVILNNLWRFTSIYFILSSARVFTNIDNQWQSNWRK